MYVTSIFFCLQEQEKKRQKVIKLLENKKVGERLGSLSDNEQPGTSSGKSKSFKSGKFHFVLSLIFVINSNDT